jgi:hypothetical protein
MNTDPGPSESERSTRLEIEAPPIVVGIVATTEWVQARLSGYGKVLTWVDAINSLCVGLKHCAKRASTARMVQCLLPGVLMQRLSTSGAGWCFLSSSC